MTARTLAILFYSSAIFLIFFYFYQGRYELIPYPIGFIITSLVGFYVVFRITGPTSGSISRYSSEYSQERETPSDDSRYIPSDVKAAVWKRDGGKCVICGSGSNLEYDHNIPVSSGGSNTVNNIRILCRKHNRKKSGKIE